MLRHIEGFLLGLDGRRDPFDANPDIAGQRHLFIFVTSRGQCSYLFPDTTENAILDQAERCIPMGYTNIWVLEWIRSVRPELGKKIRSSQRRAVQNLRQDGVQEARSCILLGENAQSFGWTEQARLAEAASQSIAAEKGVRIAIGRLRGNITWH